MGVERAGAIQAIASEKKLHTIAAFQDAAGNVDMGKVNGAISHAESFGASRNVRKNAENSMPALAGYNQTALRDIKEKNPTWSDDQVKREAVKRKHADLSNNQISDLNAKQMDANFVQAINDRTFDRASRDFTTEQRESLKKVAGPGGELVKKRAELKKQADQLTRAGKVDEAKRVIAERDNLGENLLTIRNW